MIGNNFYNIGYDSPHFKQNGGFSPEALAWENNIIGNGGTITKEKLKFFDDYFFKPAKAATRILDELDRLNIYCNLLGFPIAARTNMINSNHFVTPVSSPTFDNNGYRSSGTSYLNLNYNPFSQGVKYVRNSANHFVIVKNPTFTSLTRMMGAAEAGSTNQSVMSRTASPRLDTITNAQAASNNTNILTVGNIFFGGFRDNSLNSSSIINSSLTTNFSPSLNAPNLNILELISNFNGSPLSTGFDTLSHLCSGHGSGSLNRTDLITILNNLFTAAGI